MVITAIIWKVVACTRPLVFVYIIIALFVQTIKLSQETNAITCHKGCVGLARTVYKFSTYV
jgi:hypothetical protein